MANSIDPPTETEETAEESAEETLIDDLLSGGDDDWLSSILGDSADSEGLPDWLNE